MRGSYKYACCMMGGYLCGKNCGQHDALAFLVRLSKHARQATRCVRVDGVQQTLQIGPFIKAWFFKQQVALGRACACECDVSIASLETLDPTPAQYQISTPAAQGLAREPVAIAKEQVEHKNPADHSNCVVQSRHNKCFIPYFRYCHRNFRCLQVRRWPV